VSRFAERHTLRTGHTSQRATRAVQMSAPNSITA
jgi:hypothetical protein